MSFENIYRKYNWWYPQTISLKNIYSNSHIDFFLENIIKKTISHDIIVIFIISIFDNFGTFNRRHFPG